MVNSSFKIRCSKTDSAFRCGGIAEAGSPFCEYCNYRERAVKAGATEANGRLKPMHVGHRLRNLAFVLADGFKYVLRL